MQSSHSNDQTEDNIRVGKGKFFSPSIRQGELLSDLIHKIGHEIGNPLTSIISLASIIERFGGPTAGAGQTTLEPEKLLSAMPSCTRGN